MTQLESPRERLSALPALEREKYLAAKARKHGLTVDQLKSRLSRNWRFLARPKQLAPEWAWTFWFIMAGRGFGKTLTGAQWTKEKGLEKKCRIALVAPTRADVRVTMIEGETGLLSILPNEALRGGSRDAAYNRTTLELYLANGTYIQGYSAEEPERLRGPQHHYAWCEEISSWKDAHLGDVLETTWSNLKLGLRLGANPQACVTSTPKANKLTKELVALVQTGVLALVRGSSYENRSNLAEAWWRAIVAPLEGTRTGKQEIMAELLDDVEGALWQRARIDALRIRPDQMPQLSRIVVGVDPNVSSETSADSAGIIIAGLEFRRDWPNAFVIADRTVVRGGPRAWSVAAVDAYHEFQADRIVAEVNNGGDLVEMAIRSVDPNVAYKDVRASRGKRIRAEPISALYEGDLGSDDRAKAPKVHHVGPFPELEDEMTTWVRGDESPNRMDALVWTLTDLMLDGRVQVPMKTYVPGKDRKGEEINIAPDRFGTTGYT